MKETVTDSKIIQKGTHYICHDVGIRESSQAQTLQEGVKDPFIIKYSMEFKIQLLGLMDTKLHIVKVGGNELKSM